MVLLGFAVDGIDDGVGQVKKVLWCRRKDGCCQGILGALQALCWSASALRIMGGSNGWLHRGVIWRYDVGFGPCLIRGKWCWLLCLEGNGDIVVTWWEIHRVHRPSELV